MQPVVDEEMDDWIWDSLADLDRLPPSLPPSSGDAEPTVSSFVDDWLPFSREVAWISSELCVFIPSLEETVGAMKSLEDLHGFRMELSSVLKELECPYSAVMGPSSSSDRFASIKSRKYVLLFLLSELQASKILFASGGPKQQGKGVKVSLDETANARRLREVCEGLGVAKPPETITVGQFWTGLIGKAKKIVEGKSVLEPLFGGVLSPTQWTTLEDYFLELEVDYTMRREMLLKRLDVTVQSFYWKGQKEKELKLEFEKRRPEMTQNPDVVISDVFAARKDLAVVEKTSSTSVRKNTRSNVNDVKIGRVPDRGGRPDEVVPPPPEMPSWQQRQGSPSVSSGWIASPNQRGGGGGQRGGGRGGRVQGGWSERGGGGGGGRGGGYHQQQQGSDYQGGYQQDFQGGGGGYHQQSSNYQGGYQQDFHQGGSQQHQQGGGGGGGHRGGGYYQHDQRGDSYHQDQQQYSHGGGESRNYDNQDHRGGGRGRGRGRGQRY